MSIIQYSIALYYLISYISIKMSTTTSTISIVLTGSNDWFKWFNIIKTKAVAANIWVYSNPDNVQELQPAAPVYPSIQDAIELKGRPEYADFNTKEAFNCLISEYSSKEKIYARETQSIQALLSEVQRTVSEIYIMYITSCSSPYQALKVLKEQLAPSSEARYFDIDKQYRLLSQGKPKSQPIEQWLQKWERVFVEAQEIQHSDFNNTTARINFIQSTHSLDPGWSSIAKYTLQTAARAGTPTSTFHTLLADFKQSYRTLPSTQASNSAFPATLQGRDKEGRSTIPLPKPKCVIDGKRHFYGECYYLNEAIRPNSFKCNLELLAKAKQFLLDNPSIQEKIKQRTDQSGPNTEAKPRTYAVYSPKAFGTSGSDTFLQTSWILDSGSNIHLCNDPKRFTHTHTATEDDTITSGKDTYQIEAFGTVDITITTPQGNQEINRLINVALVPDFLTNLVSFGKMVEKNIHWNTKRKTLYATDQNGKEDHFC